MFVPLNIANSVAAVRRMAPAGSSSQMSRRRPRRDPDVPAVDERAVASVTPVDPVGKTASRQPALPAPGGSMLAGAGEGRRGLIPSARTDRPEPETPVLPRAV